MMKTFGKVLYRFVMLMFLFITMTNVLRLTRELTASEIPSNLMPLIIAFIAAFVGILLDA